MSEEKQKFSHPPGFFPDNNEVEDFYHQYDPGSPCRRRLFNMMNELPTIFEVVTGTTKKEGKEKSSNQGSNKSKFGSKMRALEGQGRQSKLQPSKDEDEVPQEEDEDGEHGDTPCGACDESNGADEFWICCDIYDKWFHGKCVKITSARAEHIKHYKCPSCRNNKRARC